MEQPIKIRRATVQDVVKIHGLLTHFSQKEELLPRPLSSLYDHLRDYVVAQDQAGNVVGCSSLQICWEDLAEVRSLAVAEAHWLKGVGSKLLDFCLADAHGFGLKRVFALTYRPGFFEKHGFSVIDKNDLPQKVWADCLHCVKFPDCDEIAVMKIL